MTLADLTACYGKWNLEFTKKIMQKKILVIRDSCLENWLQEFNKNSSIYRRPIYVMSKKINIFDSQMIPCGCSGCVQVGAGECSNLVSTTHAGGPLSPDYFDLKIHDARG